MKQTLPENRTPVVIGSKCPVASTVMISDSATVQTARPVRTITLLKCLASLTVQYRCVFVASCHNVTLMPRYTPICTTYAIVWSIHSTNERTEIVTSRQSAAYDKKSVLCFPAVREWRWGI